MKISKEFKIGFWAIVAIVVFVLGTNYLKGINTFNSGQTYYLTTNKVDGLAVSSHVTLHGFKIGVVRDMQYDKATDQVLVTINIYDDDLEIPADSRFSIAADLLGTSDFVVEMGESSKILQSGDTLQAYDGGPGLLEQADPIVSQINLLMPKIDTLVSGINVLVNESRLHESLLEINTMTQHLNTTVNELNRLLRKDVPGIVNNLQSLTSNFDTVAVQIKEADIQQLLLQTSSTIETANQLMTQLQSKESTVGKVLQTDELHEQLVTTIADMDALLKDIKENPKRYIHIKVF